ncbi:MAG: hypothetical protein CME62_11505 [Halobacteriovoraceae bacterium]|nr:hypothetical protein [Halobacteriovoraceae bacterium]|tara:strand:- start:4998 stop:5582 length:585 start_codon:yes stop_codon:yes gene_type:complete
MDLGKKVYRSTAIATIKMMAIAIIVGLFFNLYWQTFYDPEIASLSNPTFNDLIQFHLRHPYDLLSYIFFILIPCIYFGFMRGVNFYENGIYINRGLPFYNTIVFYENIERYEIVQQNLFMSVKRKKEGDEIFFSINNVDRAIAIFDQHEVPGDLVSKSRIPINMNSKVLVFILTVGVAVGVGQMSLWLSRFLFR